MSVVHKSLFVWALCLAFLVLITVRVTNHQQMNWFIVFIPMWILDIVLLSLNFARMIGFHRDNRSHAAAADHPSAKRLYWSTALVFLKTTFQGILCAYLEQARFLRLWHAMLPLWILLVGMGVDWFAKIVDLHRHAL